jgi:hypothetical protein
MLMGCISSSTVETIPAEQGLTFATPARTNTLSGRSSLNSSTGHNSNNGSSLHLHDLAAAVTAPAVPRMYPRLRPGPSVYMTDTEFVAQFPVTLTRPTLTSSERIERTLRAGAAAGSLPRGPSASTTTTGGNPRNW